MWSWAAAIDRTCSCYRTIGTTKHWCHNMKKPIHKREKVTQEVDTWGRLERNVMYQTRAHVCLCVKTLRHHTSLFTLVQLLSNEMASWLSVCQSHNPPSGRNQTSLVHPVKSSSRKSAQFWVYQSKYMELGMRNMHIFQLITKYYLFLMADTDKITDYFTFLYCTKRLTCSVCALEGN